MIKVLLETKFLISLNLKGRNYEWVMKNIEGCKRAQNKNLHSFSLFNRVIIDSEVERTKGLLYKPCFR